MKKQIAVNSSKLTITKEKVANLSENEMNNVAGGEEAAKTASSTKADFTCCWCTSTEAVAD